MASAYAQLTASWTHTASTPGSTPSSTPGTNSTSDRMSTIKVATTTVTLSTNTTTTTTTQKTGPCNFNYVGDGYCDDQNNNEECGFDGGDCCQDNGW